jgi:antitoxin PrlF
MGSRVTRKGQITIPKRVRDYLGLEPGSVVEFEPTPDGRIVLLKQGSRSRAGSRSSAAPRPQS